MISTPIFRVNLPLHPRTKMLIHSESPLLLPPIQEHASVEMAVQVTIIGLVPTLCASWFASRLLNWLSNGLPTPTLHVTLFQTETSKHRRKRRLLTGYKSIAFRQEALFSISLCWGTIYFAAYQHHFFLSPLHVSWVFFESGNGPEREKRVNTCPCRTVSMFMSHPCPCWPFPKA